MKKQLKDIEYVLTKYAADEALNFLDLQVLVDYLKSEKGCPWDRKQTMESLIKYLKEETQELIEAIEKKDLDNIMEELGDVLYQVIFLGTLMKEQSEFDLNQSVNSIGRKLIRRHEHVFGDETAQSEEEVMEIWKNAKLKEKLNKK